MDAADVAAAAAAADAAAAAKEALEAQEASDASDFNENSDDGGVPGAAIPFETEVGNQEGNSPFKPLSSIEGRGIPEEIKESSQLVLSNNSLF